MVSVVMPAYNAEKYIEAAIESIQNQTMEDWELVVVDDCSNDGTRDVINKLAEQDKRIRPIFNEVNKGTAGSRNTAMDNCRGEYIALLDADDIWHPEKLERQLKRIAETGADLSYCSYALVDANGKKCGNDYIVPEEISFSGLLEQNVIGCSTVMFTKEVADKYRFTTDFYHEDYVLWLQILRDGKKACGVKDVVSYYRLLANSRAANKLQNAVNRWKIYRNFIGCSRIRSAVNLAKYTYYGVKKYYSKGKV